MNQRLRIGLFAGPSLSAPEIHAAFAAVDADVQVLPPVQQGDILRLIEELPDVIAIIDGYFFHTPSVLHREILLALERGARVLGSSSMGALRAAELDVFGMEGIGEIYRLYRRGVIDGDDEVAVLHAAQDEGFRPLTEALVNIRHNLRRARRRGVLSAKTAARALACAQRLPFMQRTHPAIRGAATRRERAALDRFLRREAIDLKHEDALRLVREIVGRIDGSRPWPPRTSLELRRTSLFHRYQHEYAGQWVGGQYIPDRLTVAFERLLSPSFPALFRRVSRSCIVLDEAAHRRLVSAGAQALLATFRRARCLSSDAAYHAWLRRQRISQDELLQLLRERDLERRLLELYRAHHPTLRSDTALQRCVTRDVAARHGTPESALTPPLMMSPGVPWTAPLMRELKYRGTFARAVDRARRILGHNTALFERDPRFARAPVRRGLLNEFFARRWGIEHQRLDESLGRRGFTGDGEFVEAARHVYVYEKTVRARSPDAWENLSDCFVQPW